MTLADAAILVSSLLPVVCAGLAKSKGVGIARREGGYDNHNPRQWLSGLQGWQARANAAQQNCFEALPLFIAGVLIAERVQPAMQGRIDTLALAFVVVRLAYIAAYVADRATLRSLLWTAGLGISIALFFVR